MADDTGLNLEVRALFEEFDKDVAHIQQTFMRLASLIEGANQKMASSFERNAQMFQGLFRSVGQSIGGIAAIAVGGFGAAIREAGRFQEQMRTLEVMVKAQKGDWGAAKAQFDATAASLGQLGISHEAVAASIQQAMQRNINFHDSLVMTTAAEKIHVATGKDEHQIMMALEAAYRGSMFLAERQGLITKAQVKAGGDVNTILKAQMALYGNVSAPKTFQTAMEGLQGAMSNLLTTVGMPLLQPLTDFVNKLSDGAKKVEDFVKSLSPAQVQAAALGAALLALGPGMGFIADMTRGIPVIGSIAQKMLEMRGHLTGIGGEGLKAGGALASAFKGLPNVTDLAGKGIKSVAGGAMAAAGAAKAAGPSLMQMGKTALAAAGEFVSLSSSEQGHIAIGALATAGNKAAKESLDIMADGAKRGAKGLLDLTVGIAKVNFAPINIGAKGVMGSFRLLGAAAKGAYMDIIGPLVPLLPAILAIAAVVALVWLAWKTNFGHIQEHVTAFVDGIKKFVQDWRQHLADAIEFVSDFVTKHKLLFVALMLPIMPFILAVRGIIAVFKEVHDEFSRHSGPIVKLWEGVRDGVGKAIDEMVTAFKGLIDWIEKVLQTMLKWIDKIPFLRDAVHGLMSSLQSLADAGYSQAAALKEQQRQQDLIRSGLESDIRLHHQAADARTKASKALTGAEKVTPTGTPTTSHKNLVAEAIKQDNERIKLMKDEYELNMKTIQDVHKAFLAAEADKRVVGLQGQMQKKQWAVEWSSFETQEFNKSLKKIQDRVDLEQITEVKGFQLRISAIQNFLATTHDLSMKDREALDDELARSEMGLRKKLQELGKKGVEESFKFVAESIKEGTITLAGIDSAWVRIEQHILALKLPIEEQTALLERLHDTVRSTREETDRLIESWKTSALDFGAAMEAAAGKALVQTGAVLEGQQIMAKATYDREIARINDEQVKRQKALKEAHLLMGMSDTEYNEKRIAIDGAADAQRLLAAREEAETEYKDRVDLLEKLASYREKIMGKDKTAWLQMLEVELDTARRVWGEESAQFQAVMEKISALRVEEVNKDLKERERFASGNKELLALVLQDELNAIHEKQKADKTAHDEWMAAEQNVQQQMRDNDVAIAMEHLPLMQRLALAATNWGTDFSKAVDEIITGSKRAGSALRDLMRTFLTSLSKSVSDYMGRGFQDFINKQIIPFLHKFIPAIKLPEPSKQLSPEATALKSAGDALVESSTNLGTAADALLRAAYKFLGETPPETALPVSPWRRTQTIPEPEGVGAGATRAFGGAGIFETVLAAAGRLPGPIGQIASLVSGLVPGGKAAQTAQATQNAAAMTAVATSFGTATTEFQVAVTQFQAAVTSMQASAAAAGAGGGGGFAGLIGEAVGGFSPYGVGSALGFGGVGTALASGVGGYQHGGFVRGPRPLPGGAIPILAHEGEYVGRPGRGMPAGMAPAGTTVHMNPSLNLTIQAMDSRSGAEWAVRNAQPLADAMMLAMRDNHMFRRIVNANLPGVGRGS